MVWNLIYVYVATWFKLQKKHASQLQYKIIQAIPALLGQMEGNQILNSRTKPKGLDLKHNYLDTILRKFVI